MTALPKHWPSSRRQGKRRASHAGPKFDQLTTCKHCQQAKKTGYICQNCNQ